MDDLFWMVAIDLKKNLKSIGRTLPRSGVNIDLLQSVFSKKVSEMKII